MKKLIFFIFLLNLSFSYAQTYTKNDISAGLQGKWDFSYEKDSTSRDSSWIIKKIVLKIQDKECLEIGYFKDGSKKFKSKAKWKFIESYRKEFLRIEFYGGIWIDNQDFYIIKIEDNKIHMLSIDKEENETRAFLTRI